MAQIQNINLNRFELKLADSDDPVALKVSWNPLKPGGANFKTQTLKFSGQKVTVEKTKSFILFALVFAVPGALAVVIGVPFFLLQGNIFASLFMLIWGGMFSGAGFWMLISQKPLTFDKSLGIYFHGQKYETQMVFDREQQGRLSEIYALQLLSEAIHSHSSRGHSSHYTSYELNLVFKDGGRLNVMDHGNVNEIEVSAQKLADFLRVPIWQAIY